MTDDLIGLSESRATLLARSFSNKIIDLSKVKPTKHFLPQQRHANKVEEAKLLSKPKTEHVASKKRPSAFTPIKADL